jgi:hypothetical protein
MKKLIRLAWDALFLSETPYAEMREGTNPALYGLGLVVLIALAVALVGLVGTALEWATTPNMADIQDAVFEGIQEMDWYEELQSEDEFNEAFSQWYDTGWRVFPQLFGAPSLATAGARIIFLPLGLGLVWLLYGVVAHLFARMLGGKGDLGQTLGCTALAVAPQLLNLATLLPYVVIGGVVGTWTLLCRYTALKTCHRLNWSRALAATLLPYVAFGLLVSLFVCMGGTVFGLIVGGISQ